ncbi:hypothetical protein NE237_008695 [Protea cynaroides]|uniref:Uncharacterized protein n=1 Tax=Protea cynaroides TaxID=273540 RepID=A0A9Q0KWB1_9MAGN|nr:hypothetical protein NE237_008695 [Protea cynaroides]
MIWFCFIVAVVSMFMVAMEPSFFPFGSPSIFEDISKDMILGHRVELEVGLLSCFLFISGMVPMAVFVYLSKRVKEIGRFSFQDSLEDQGCLVELSIGSIGINLHVNLYVLCVGLMSCIL